MSPWQDDEGTTDEVLTVLAKAYEGGSSRARIGTAEDFHMP